MFCVLVFFLSTLYCEHGTYDGVGHIIGCFSCAIFTIFSTSRCWSNDSQSHNWFADDTQTMLLFFCLLFICLLATEDRVVPRIILSSANTMRISHRSYQNKSIPKPGLISQYHAIAIARIKETTSVETLLGIRTISRTKYIRYSLHFQDPNTDWYLVKFYYSWHQCDNWQASMLPHCHWGWFDHWRSVLADVSVLCAGLWLRSPVWGRQTTDTRVCSDWDLESGECCSLLQLTGDTGAQLENIC